MGQRDCLPFVFPFEGDALDFLVTPLEPCLPGDGLDFLDGLLLLLPLEPCLSFPVFGEVEGEALDFLVVPLPPLEPCFSFPFLGGIFSFSASNRNSEGCRGSWLQSTVNVIFWTVFVSADPDRYLKKLFNDPRALRPKDETVLRGEASWLFGALRVRT